MLSIDDNPKNLLHKYETNSIAPNLFSAGMGGVDPEVVPYTEEEIIDNETKLYGMTVTIDPYQVYKDKLGDIYDMTDDKERMNERSYGSESIILGKIAEVKQYTPASGKVMAFLKIENDRGEMVEATVFSENYIIFRNYIQDGNILLLGLMKQEYRGGASYLLDKVKWF